MNIHSHFCLLGQFYSQYVWMRKQQAVANGEEPILRLGMPNPLTHFLLPPSEKELAPAGGALGGLRRRGDIGIRLTGS